MTKHKWNGSGMAALTPERRKEIGAAAAKRAKANRSGWPTPVAYLSDPNYYTKTNDEFTRRMDKARLNDL